MTELQKSDSDILFENVTKFKNDILDNFLTYGQNLSLIKRKGYHKGQGFKSFKELIETKFNISSSFANKLISVYDVFVDNLDIDEFTLNLIGFDRLCMILPFVKDSEIEVVENWISESKEKDIPDLKKSITKEKEQLKKPRPLKDVFTDQVMENLRVIFNCPQKQLNYYLAVYFHQGNMKELKNVIKDIVKEFEQNNVVSHKDSVNSFQKSMNNLLNIEGIDGISISVPGMDTVTYKKEG